MESFKMVDEAKEFLTKNLTGIGEKKAEKIVNLFPDVTDFLTLPDRPDVYEKLNSAFTPSFSKNLVGQLTEIKKQDDYVKMLIRYGVEYYKAVAIAKDPEKKEAFEKDPYEVGASMEIDYIPIDSYVHKQFKDVPEGPDLAKSRMVHLLDYLIQIKESNGNTYVTLTQLTDDINHYQARHQFAPNNFEQGNLLLYLSDENLFYIKCARENDSMGDWQVFRRETYEKEVSVAKNVIRLIPQHKEENIEKLKGWLRTGIFYDDCQLEAISSVEEPGLHIITGPPGSGKTAVVKGILQYFHKFYPDQAVLLCAPTGRAAKHLTEITGEPASTINKMLGMGWEKGFIRSGQLNAGLIICDEASMLNLDITSEFFARIQNGTRVFLIGDENQLPAVGAGNVLHDIIGSGLIPTYRLQKVYRQDGLILNNAQQINHGSSNLGQDETFSYETLDEEELKNKALNLFDKLYDPSEPFETQILAPSYKAECGINALNEAIQAKNPEAIAYRSHSGQTIYKKNDKILMVKNDSNGLYQNGSIGLFKYEIGDEVVVDFEGEEVNLPKTALNDMTLGYAVSVHKSQGSEYKNVILCLPSKPSNMLRRDIVYTGVTRAKKHLNLLCEEGALEQAVKRTYQPLLQTGLKTMIGDAA